MQKRLGSKKTKSCFLIELSSFFFVYINLNVKEVTFLMVLNVLVSLQWKVETTAVGKKSRCRSEESVCTSLLLGWFAVCVCLC